MRLVISKINQFEIPLCVFFNRINNKQLIHNLFSTVSRLGDGLIWYCTMVSLPLLHGGFGIKITIAMILTSVPGVIIYKLMKISTRRPRPYRFSEGITQGTHALDQFSFPSGHTLHAVGFSVVLIHFLPAIAVLVVPFAILVAVSRLVLGLHYPSDVLVGALLGYVLALNSLEITSHYLFPF